jgi:hypothetical protein
MPKSRRRKVCRETLVDPLSQADHDCRGEASRWRRKHALNGVAEGRSE